MQFGYGLLTGQRIPGSDKSYEMTYEEMIKLASMAEDYGFDTIHTSEHHFFDDGYSPSVLPLSAALARETEHVGIATTIALAPLYDPIRLAEDAATIDILSGGRFILGLANGYMQAEFDAFDIPRSERARRVVETIEICRRAWVDEKLSFDGDIFTYDNLRVEPKPVQDGGPDIYLGGTSKPAIRRSARRCDGHIGIVYYDSEMQYKSSFEQFADNVELLNEERTVAADDFTISVMQYTHVDSSSNTAWETLAPSLIYSRRKYAEHADGRDASRWDRESMTDERMAQLRAGAMVGNPEEVIERLRAYEEAVPGELHFLARMWHPGLPFEEQVAALKLFGEEVIPALS
ncbi:LLM class flavin-dependent oxidoreductase [Halalkalirubrum salinum]|uniref:LLM class flavin-dependent oxidoreductase n=1 Tax=Halalkalirubrum salinum TaxID=2563889 RepID=UPI0010FB2045|nr:LLM class flavin-dependent oxidoreductase [Halalkalirubrum salinum]